MGGLFSKQKSRHPKEPSRITDADRAVLQLKQQRDKLKQYQKKLVSNIERERLLAKRLLQENKKEKALLLLKKKKYQENLISKTDGQLENIEQLVHDIEYTQIESQVLEGLKTGNESLKQLQTMMSIEDVERIMDETADAVEYQRQISDLISGGLSAQDVDDVEDELEALLASQEGDVSLPDVPSDEPAGAEPHLPDVPATEPSQTVGKPERVMLTA